MSISETGFYNKACGKLWIENSFREIRKSDQLPHDAKEFKLTIHKCMINAEVAIITMVFYPKLDKGAFIYDVRCFTGIFDLPTYPHQILYYISLIIQIR